MAEDKEQLPKAVVTSVLYVDERAYVDADDDAFLFSSMVAVLHRLRPKNVLALLKISSLILYATSLVHLKQNHRQTVSLSCANANLVRFTS